ncbi:MAG: DNA repair protein RecO [Bdellovibrionales bacterium]
MKEKLIVLRTFKWSEADLMVHGLNPQGARMSFIARGAMKSRKRFSGGILEPTHYILAHYRPSQSRHDESPLHNLQEAELIKGFNGLRDVYERLETALSMVGLMEKVAQPGVTDSSELFDLLGNGLFAAESSTKLEMLKLQFEAKLLYVQGVLPSQGWFADLLKHPLRDHGRIEISHEELRRFQNELKSLLQRHLQGLSPMGNEGGAEV